MSNYEIGKDIKDIANRLEHIEALLEDCRHESSKDSICATDEQGSSEAQALELPNGHELEKSGYKWIIHRVSLTRTCKRLPPFNKAYSRFEATCWSHLGKEKDDPTGPAFNCRRIELSYKHGSNVGIDTPSIGHSSDKIRHCHGATLTGKFRAHEGEEFTILVTSI